MVKETVIEVKVEGLPSTKDTQSSASTDQLSTNDNIQDSSANISHGGSATSSLHQFHIPEQIKDIGHQIANEIYYDDDNLENVQHFQYKTELNHRFSVSSIVGLGFSLMNVPFGVATTLSIGLVCGSNVTILWGWILFGFFSIMISLSLSEIASKFPTSGGVYHYSCILSDEKYSLMTSWFDGWYLTLGNVLMFVSYAFGGSQFILSIFGLVQSDYKEDSGLIMLVFILIILLSSIINIKFQKYLEKFNELCIYWTFYTILFTDILILLFATDFHSIKDIFTYFNASRSGWPDSVAFIIGGIQFASMTFNGYGAIVSMSEEVKVPEKTIPKGLIYSIFASIFTGLVFIIPLLSVLPEMNRLLDDNPDIFPIDIVLKLSTKSFLVSFVISFMIVGAIMFACVGALTTASRTIYSLSRDHGVPFSKYFKELDKSTDEIVPRNALFLAVATSILFGTFSLISTSAFNAFLGCSVMSMNVANGIPIFCSVIDRRRKIRGATFKLRKFGYIINICSCFMIILTCIILCFPPSLDIDIQSMNYSIVVFILMTISILLGYHYWGRYHFIGPLLTVEPDTNSVIQLERIDKSLSYPKNIENIQK